MKVIQKVLIGAIVLLWSITPAFAIGAQGLGGYPTTYNPDEPLTKSWFIFELAAGESAESSITIENYSDTTKTVVLYPVDSTVNNMGGFALETETDATDHVGAWIALSESEFSLQPGETRDVPFTFAVPTSVTEPGEYSGGIIIQEQKSDEAAAGITIMTRIGIRVYNTVPGTIYQKLELTNFSAEYDKLQDAYLATATLKNKSNVTTEATLNLYTKPLRWGRTDSILNQSVLLPPNGETTTNFTVPNPKWGKYAMALEAVYDNKLSREEESLRSTTLTFWALPILLLAWIGILLAVNLAAIAWSSMRKALNRRDVREYTVQRGDTIDSVATKFGMRWKLLAQLNHLRKPYTLKAKQKLLVRPLKTAKGTKKVVLRPVRTWASIATASLVLTLALALGVWSTANIANPAILKGSVLEFLIK